MPNTVKRVLLSFGDTAEVVRDVNYDRHLGLMISAGMVFLTEQQCRDLAHELLRYLPVARTDGVNR